MAEALLESCASRKPDDLGVPCRRISRTTEEDLETDVRASRRHWLGLPSLTEVKKAWRGDWSSWFPRIPAEPGFFDAALFQPTYPPGHRALSRLSFLVTMDLIRSLPGASVFDVAAGPCFMAAALHHDGKQVSVNDLRPTDTALSIWGLSETVPRHTADIFSLDPSTTGLFDVVLCAELIEHVAHPRELLHHLRRFLHPGGHLVVTTPNGAFAGNRLPTLSQVRDLEELEKRQFQPDSDGHLFLLTPAELREILEQARFSLVRTILFGVPAVSGFLKFRHLSFLRLPAVWYGFEKLAQVTPLSLRARVASHMLMCGRSV